MKSSGFLQGHFTTFRPESSRDSPRNLFQDSSGINQVHGFFPREQYSTWTFSGNSFGSFFRDYSTDSSWDFFIIFSFFSAEIPPKIRSCIFFFKKMFPGFFSRKSSERFLQGLPPGIPPRVSPGIPTLFFFCLNSSRILSEISAGVLQGFL